jgi:lipoprotein-anchoring transpeptidase ErfK/SrfK
MFVDLASSGAELVGSLGKNDYSLCMTLQYPRIEVSIGTQRLRLFDGMRLVREWACSTSRFGIGFTEGSNKTPLGGFVVMEKHGGGAECGTIFKARQPVGHWRPGDVVEGDLVLTRILWLAGDEERNANTFDRYIYIHGTNDEQGIGRAGSHGCVRMRNRDVMDLYELVPVGTAVWIME